MKADLFVRTLLLLITVSLVLNALGPHVASQQAQTESEACRSFYIEPGTTMLVSPDGSHNVIGIVVVDLKNGKIWGFPTHGPHPYPKASVTGKPPVVSPIYLGRYNLDATTR
jgi:hypothetical protein